MRHSQVQAARIAIHQRGGDHEISRCTVACNRDIPHNCHTQKRLDIGIVRHGFQRIPEEDQEIDAPVGDHGADLLVTPQRPTLQLVDTESELALKHVAGCTGCIDLVVRHSWRLNLAHSTRSAFLLSCATTAICLSGSIWISNWVTESPFLSLW
jgi:hypothetical protein